MQPVQIGNYFDLLGQSQKAYSRQLEPVCKKWDLTRSEVDVLLFLFNNPQYDRAADIVAHRGMTKSHVSMSVANLEERGLLLRRFDPADRRQAHLELTRQGLEIAGEAKEQQTRFFCALYRGVTEEEFVLWRKITQKICDNIENFDISLTNP